jgi:hypothetical protein
VTRYAKREGKIELVPADTTYGLAIDKYITNGIVINLIRAPDFCAHPAYTQNALILDMKNIDYCPFEDTRLVPRIGDPNKNNPLGTDAYVEEYMTDCTLQLDFEETHAWLQGLTSIGKVG